VRGILQWLTPRRKRIHTTGSGHSLRRKTPFKGPNFAFIFAIQRDKKAIH
jgi:hypothetical protein